MHPEKIKERKSTELMLHNLFSEQNAYRKVACELRRLEK